MEFEHEYLKKLTGDVGYLFILACSLVAACSGSRTEETRAVTTCYTYTTDSDSIMLQLTRNGDAVEGELTYILYEKDINRGTIKGVMEGDTLFADYTFRSEGITSVREVAFVKHGDELVEAFGELEEQNGKVVFSDPSLLSLNESVVLKASACGD